MIYCTVKIEKVVKKKVRKFISKNDQNTSERTINNLKDENLKSDDQKQKLKQKIVA